MIRIELWSHKSNENRLWPLCSKNHVSSTCHHNKQCMESYTVVHGRPMPNGFEMSLPSISYLVGGVVSYYL
jgi:hypothetical protein